MFYFHFMGGLGNQMFQFAAARALSLKRDVAFRCDFDCPNPNVLNRFALDVFNVDVRMANAMELWRCKPKRRIAKRIYRLLDRNPDCLLIKETKDFRFDPAFFSIADGSYVSGFWQSEKYFIDIADVIRRDFRFRFDVSGRNLRLSEQMRVEESVSVHIRRGDYVTDDATHKLHGVCGVVYYRAAAATMRERLRNPMFYVFSDDIDWAKENIHLGPTVFVDFNRGRDYEDMRLMSCCRHHIIANSSFSWWGAWLNPDRDKIVIAPSRWITDPEVDTRDLLPGAWITLEV
jgi:hypothetical protein